MLFIRIRNFCLDPDSEISKLDPSGSGINHSGSTTLLMSHPRNCLIQLENQCFGFGWIRVFFADPDPDFKNPDPDFKNPDPDFKNPDPDPSIKKLIISN